MFLEAFGFASLRDLPELERLKAEGPPQTGQGEDDLDSALGWRRRSRKAWKATSTFDVRWFTPTTLPRLGSRVRIPSPAPNLYKEVK
jgi:hypothetical protein